MAGNTSFQFNVNTLGDTKVQIEEVKSALKSNFSDIKSSIRELMNNINSSQIQGQVTKISQAIDNIDLKTSDSFEKLVKFLEVQVKNYTNTYRTGASSLLSAISKINNR